MAPRLRWLQDVYINILEGLGSKRIEALSPSQTSPCYIGLHHSALYGTFLCNSSPMVCSDMFRQVQREHLLLGPQLPDDGSGMLASRPG